MLILLYHLWLDSSAAQSGSQESIREGGGRGILFQSIWGNGGEGEQGYVPERLWEVRSLAGEVLPHKCPHMAEHYRSLSSCQDLTSPHGKPLMGPQP